MKVYICIVSTTMLQISAATTRVLSFASIAGYEPIACVDAERALALDVKSIRESLFEVNDSNLAQQIYAAGLHSGATSSLSLGSALPSSYATGTSVSGFSADGSIVTGKVIEDVQVGASMIQIEYDAPSCGMATDFSTTFSQCLVGANSPPITSRCLASASTLSLDGESTVTYSYDVLGDTFMNTVQGSWSTPKTTPAYAAAASYFGMSNFLEAYVYASLNGSTFDGENGPTFFGPFSQQRRQVAFSESLVWANYVSVVASWEGAIQLCQSGNEAASTRMTDTATAWYIGASSSAASTRGHSLYEFANEACVFSATCGDGNVAQANSQILEASAALQEATINGDCIAARDLVQNKLIPVSRIPWIQTLKMLAFNRNDEIARTRGATLASALQPSLFECNLNDSRSVYFFFSSLLTTSDLINALENNFACLGVTCSDIGDVNGAGVCQDASVPVPPPTPSVPAEPVQPLTPNPAAAVTTPPSSAPTPSFVAPPPSPFPTTLRPTAVPTRAPTTAEPTNAPSRAPVTAPPTATPTKFPTLTPSIAPSVGLTPSPTVEPSTLVPTISPSVSPTTRAPTTSPTTAPTLQPTPASTAEEEIAETTTMSPVTSNALTGDVSALNNAGSGAVSKNGWAPQIVVTTTSVIALLAVLG